MNETRKRWLILIGVLVGIGVYVHRMPHKTPEQEKQDYDLAQAEAYGKAAAEGDLKSLPSGTYICTVIHDDWGEGDIVHASCSDVRDKD